MRLFERAKTVETRDGRVLTRSMFLQNAVGEPSERLVVMTMSFGGWLETKDEPLYFETSVFDTDHTQQPRAFVRVVERYQTAAEAFDGHNRWCILLDQPRPANFQEDDL
jgi:hypothetical protein